MSLTPDQLRRYSRHVILSDVGVEGQEKLLNARVLIVGCGGLGAPTSLYLAAAGVGTIGLLDFDVVDESNLQRQVLYTTKDVGRKKAEVAKERLAALNPGINLICHDERLAVDNVERLFADYDYIIDGTDNFATRYLVNDACVMLGKVNVYGSIFQFEGQASIFAHPDGPCYRCLFPEPPNPGEVPNCAEGGVFGVLPGQIGVTQATEAVKLILGIGTSLVGRLMVFDAMNMRWKELKVRRDPACPVCGENPKITELNEYTQFCSGAPQVDHEPGIDSMTPLEAKALLASNEDVFFLDVREEYEYQMASLAGTTLIPLGQLEQRLGELLPHKEQTILAHCKAGMRSLRALEILKEHGFTKLINVSGGIDRWLAEVDEG
ncbi:molybdenum cofactor biosynthesis protein MoeB [bacterium M21]|nr:molybdenum cofactor biosynthesis protein MoeB [bacterium M21]